MKEEKTILVGSIYKEGKHYHWKVKFSDGKEIMSNPLAEFRTRKLASTDLLNTLLKK